MKSGGRMFKQVMISLLFAMSVIAILWTEANAGCARIGGKQICGSWITGSEICNTKSTGLGNIKDCDPDAETCPVVTCSAFGTVPLVAGADCTDNFDPDNTSCGIPGIAFCVNPAGNASKAQGQPFTLDAVLSESTDITRCDKNGRCLSTVELEADPSAVICINPNWTFKTFTASEFFGEIKLCPGGYDNTVPEPQCCSTIERNPGGSCVSTAPELIIRELCSVDLTGIKLGETRAYSCAPVSS